MTVHRASTCERSRASSCCSGWRSLGDRVRDRTGLSTRTARGGRGGIQPRRGLARLRRLRGGGNRRAAAVWHRHQGRMLLQSRRGRARLRPFARTRRATCLAGEFSVPRISAPAWVDVRSGPLARRYGVPHQTRPTSKIGCSRWPTKSLRKGSSALAARGGVRCV